MEFAGGCGAPEEFEVEFDVAVGNVGGGVGGLDVGELGCKMGGSCETLRAFERRVDVWVGSLRHKRYQRSVETLASMRGQILSVD